MWFKKLLGLNYEEPKEIRDRIDRIEENIEYQKQFRCESDRKMQEDFGIKFKNRIRYSVHN